MNEAKIASSTVIIDIKTPMAGYSAKEIARAIADAAARLDNRPNLVNISKVEIRLNKKKLETEADIFGVIVE